jgi:hypothetical protein
MEIAYMEYLNHTVSFLVLNKIITGPHNADLRALIYYMARQDCLAICRKGVSVAYSQMCIEDLQ